MQFYIETKRLIMRDLLPTDDAGMFALDSDPDVHRYVGRKPVQTIEQSRNVIQIIRAQYETNGIGRWAIIEKSSNNFIGWGGLKLMTQLTNGHINYLDVGYRFIKQYWGIGYATETAQASVSYALDAFRDKKVFGMANVDNAASRRVLEKAGLSFVELFDYEEEEHAWYRL